MLRSIAVRGNSLTWTAVDLNRIWPIAKTAAFRNRKQNSTAIYLQSFARGRESCWVERPDCRILLDGRLRRHSPTPQARRLQRHSRLGECNLPRQFGCQLEVSADKDV